MFNKYIILTSSQEQIERKSGLNDEALEQAMRDFVMDEEAQGIMIVKLNHNGTINLQERG